MKLRGRALLATAFLAVSACSGPNASSTQSAGGSALATATATAEATNASTSASASSTSSDQPPAFENLSLATVLVNGLAVRTAAGLGSALLQRRSMPGGVMEDVRLNEGNHVYVLSSGPSQPVDGQWWFQVAIEGDPAYVADAQAVDVGWVAVGTAGDPWIREDNGFCDARPTFVTLVGMSRIVRVGCYGSAPLTIDAFQATVPPNAGLGGACENYSNPLHWLLCDNINYSFVNAAGSRSSSGCTSTRRAGSRPPCSRKAPWGRIGGSSAISTTPLRRAAPRTLARATKGKRNGSCARPTSWWSRSRRSAERPRPIGQDDRGAGRGGQAPRRTRTRGRHRMPLEARMMQPLSGVRTHR